MVTTRTRRRLGELLVAEGLISPEQLAEALTEHRRSKERLGSVLVGMGLVTEGQLAALLSAEHGIPAAPVADVPVPPDSLHDVLADLAAELRRLTSSMKRSVRTRRRSSIRRRRRARRPS